MQSTKVLREPILILTEKWRWKNIFCASRRLDQPYASLCNGFSRVPRLCPGDSAILATPLDAGTLIILINVVVQSSVICITFSVWDNMVNVAQGSMIHKFKIHWQHYEFPVYKFDSLAHVCVQHVVSITTRCIYTTELECTIEDLCISLTMHSGSSRARTRTSVLAIWWLVALAGVHTPSVMGRISKLERRAEWLSRFFN